MNSIDAEEEKHKWIKDTDKIMLRDRNEGNGNDHDEEIEDEILEGLPSKLERYSFKYRVQKTCLLLIAWVSLGVNNEIIGSTYEDVRILFSLDYQRMSGAIVLRTLGYLGVTTVAGILYDKFTDYADLIMAFSSLFVAIPNFIIPITYNYWTGLFWFLVQGVATAVYDLGGNRIVFDVWQEVATSPINAMHAGYGLGALMAVQIVKRYIKFDPAQQIYHEALDMKKNKTFNNSTSSLHDSISAKDIDIQIPYSIAASIGVALAISFVIAQYYEQINSKRYSELKLQFYQHKVHPDRKHAQAIDIKEHTAAILAVISAANRKAPLYQRVLFGNKVYKGKALVYQFVQIALLFVLFFCLSGYLTVISRFMLTYITQGPAKQSVYNFILIQTLYWMCFVLSRFTAAFLGYKYKPLNYVLVIFLLNMLVCFTFIIPHLAQPGAPNAFEREFEITGLFFWIAVSMMGLTSGPLHPSSFMAAQTILNQYNSFVSSIFFFAMAFGNIFFQQISALLLDAYTPSSTWMGFSNTNSSFIIAYLFFLPSLACLILYGIILFIYKKFIHHVHEQPQN